MMADLDETVKGDRKKRVQQQGSAVDLERICQGIAKLIDPRAPDECYWPACNCLEQSDAA